MYKMKLLLKFIITVLSIIGVIVTNNFYVLLSFLVATTILLFINNKKLLSLFSLLLLLYLIFSLNPWYLFIKFVVIIFIIYLFIIYLTIRQKLFLKGKFRDKNIRKSFYERNIKNTISNLETKAEENYGNKIEIKDKVNSDLERQFLQSRIRFFGFKNSQSYQYETSWKRLDYLILLFSIILFVIILII